MPSLQGLAWRNIGPATAGGRASGVAGTDADPNLYYFGGADGGVWKTTNGGLTWRNAWPQDAPGAIGAIAIDSQDRNTVWAGTGEPNFRNDISYGDGVWVTHDGGAHWRNAGLRETWAIAQIVIDPRDSRRVWAAAAGNPYRDSGERGVYRTLDGGRTWQRTLYLGPSSGASDVAIDPRNSNVVFAGIWQFRRVPWSFSSGGPLDGIFKSVDGGSTWRRLRGNGLPRGDTGRIGLGVAGARVYALIQSREGVLWRSDDGGAAWRLMTRDTLVNQRPFYMSRLAVDPSDSNRVFFSSEDLIETRDGGKTFEDVTGAVHQDHHGLWISRNGRRIIEANDGGAPISIDGGTTWDWRFNVVLAQIYRLGYDEQNPYHVCGGIQDNDSYCGPSDSLSPLGIENSDWRDVGNDGDGSWVWPEPGSPSSIWNVGVNELNGQLGIFDLNSRQNYDITPDVTDTNGRALAGLQYRANWEAPIAFGGTARPSAPIAYYGANVLFESMDRGRRWVPVSPDLTRNDPSKQQVAGGPINTDISGAEFYDTIFDIAPSRLEPSRIWVGTDDGLVQLTPDWGAHWRNVTPPDVAPWGRIDTVEASSADPMRAYVAIDRHVMGDASPYILVTDDSGTTWRTIVNGLPRDQYVHVVREDPANPNVLYAGLEQGVWFTLDRGLHWHSLRLNMPSVAVHDMRIQPEYRDLVVATHGRGFWILDDLAGISGLSSAVAAGTPALFPARTAYTWYRWWTSYYGTHADECCLSAGTYAGEDPPEGATLTYYLPAPTRARIEVRDAIGRRVRCFDAAGDAGVQRTAWDLTETPPVPWLRARSWNRGGPGPTVIPGRRYAIALHAGGTTVVQTLDVKPDPRAAWTQAQYMERYLFVKTLDDELSATDLALNRMDALPYHDKAVYSMFTSDVVNSEDDLLKPDRLRERLTILQGVIELSQGPPTPAQQREADAIQAQFDTTMTAYRAFLSAHHLPPDKNPEVCE
ncbi:MAG TPA: hypothetical protein VFF63_08595 [Candidatus Babeliales bacterium]|nr:hypothetical protein [Candidatus Babeliales bacterium]